MLRRRLKILAFLTLALACTKKNPKYCASDLDCPTGRCDLTAKQCTAADGGADARDAEAGDARDAGDVPFRCKGGSDCVDAGPDGSAAVCELEAGACVECVRDDDCKLESAPICNLTTHSCERCTTDLQCVTKLGSNPGICMSHQDGRCATDAETIYVKNAAGCSMTAGSGGTKDVPYCLSQDGINAATAQQSLVVLRGPDPLTEWSVAAMPASPISVIGQVAATVNPGARIGIHLSAGEVYIRGLRVSGGSNVGIVADGAAQLTLDGCVVDSNAKGGLLLGTSSFDVTNAVIAKNGPGTDTGGVTWGGVRVSVSQGSVPGTTRFLNNTVVQNSAAGISCATDVVIAGSIVFGNVTADVAGCTISPCCSGDPMLSSDYHLTSTSNPACIDQLDPAISTSHDIDGQSRPRGAQSDCGADEY